MQAQIDRDWRRRRTAAARAQLPAEQEWRWSEICPRLTPSEYSNFQPWIYSLDIVLPVLDLRQQRDWAPRLYAEDGTAIRPLFALPESLPLVGGTWGLGHLVRLWEWFAIFAGWTLAFLFAASVSGIIKKD